MKLQYLGTAAAEGFPAMFCICDNCRRARLAGGKNVRTRSQSIIDDRLLIDFPADTYHHMLTFGIALPDVRNVLVTHSHTDHFYPADLEMRAEGFAVTESGTHLNVYGGDTVYDAVTAEIKSTQLSEKDWVVPHKVTAFEPFEVDGYSVTALPAMHDKNVSPFIYIIEKDGKTLLYAHDTGLLEENVCEWLKNSRKHFDFVSLDCTAGLLKGWRCSHLGLDTCTEFMQTLRETGTADSGTGVCLNHFSHNCLATYDEMLTEAAKSGFDVAYDGKTVTF